jgi:hypothetical protein
MPFGLFTTSRPASPTKGPGHIYKLTLDGRIVGRFVACPPADMLFVADRSSPATR